MEIIKRNGKTHIYLEEGEDAPEIHSKGDNAVWFYVGDVFACLHIMGPNVSATFWGINQPRINVYPNANGRVQTLWMREDKGAPTVVLNAGNFGSEKKVHEFEVKTDEEE